MHSINIGLVGCGYWGPNLVRTLLEIPQVTMRVVADRDPQRVARIKARHPQIAHTVGDYREMLSMPLDAVIVSTPPQTHYRIVRACLLRGLDVFVEKPLTTRASDASRLVELAERNHRVLMVGHIGAYNPAVRALKKVIDAGDLGGIRYIDAVRGGLGLFHPQLGVIWDLAPHDIAIMLYLLGESPASVSAWAAACVQESIDDIAHVALAFGSGVRAHARVSWLDPRKSRQVTVVGTRGMAVFDDLETEEKLKVYDKRVDPVLHAAQFGEFGFAYHHGGVVSPSIDGDEPLRLECLHFVECVLARVPPITDGRNGAEVVTIIEAAHESLRMGGARVRIRPATRRAAGNRSGSERAAADRSGVAAVADGPALQRERIVALPEIASASLARAEIEGIGDVADRSAKR